jgi:hypothetical protein
LYREPDGSFLITGHGGGQADFFYVPMQHADAFIQATQLLTDYDVPLECGFPKLMDILRHGPSNATVLEVPLCTTWNPGRGNITMIERCKSEKWSPARDVQMISESESKSYAVYHPIKIRVNGYKAWDKAWDSAFDMA